MKKVGTNFFNYNTLRNFAGLKIDGFKFIKVHDISKIIEYPFYKLFNWIPLVIHNVFVDLFTKKVDLYHFFNTTYVGEKPWIVTIENITPHLGITKTYILRFGLKQLAKDNCKLIIAMSQNSYNRQMFLIKHFPDLYERIAKKMTIVHPTQQLFVSDVIERTYNLNNVHFAFIGKYFFHKGGLELLRAVDRCISEGYAINLTVVSSFQLTRWLDNHIKEEHFHEAKFLIAKNSKYIKHRMQIPNTEVLEILKTCDVGLLPSYGESYGYSVLESQAYGCPVITTNVWALEEINNNEKGWILDVPRVLEEGGFVADISTSDRLRNFSQMLEDSLYFTIKNILDNPEVIVSKGRVAIEDIRNKHNPENASIRLKEIYKNALN